MSDIAHFFTPVDLDAITSQQNYNPTQLGSLMQTNSTNTDFPDVEATD